MQPKCPEWTPYIGLAFRQITNEPDAQPRAMSEALKRVQEAEAAVRDDEERGGEALHL